MIVMVFLMFAGATVALAFLAAFFWAVQTGQFDDVASPPIRILQDDSRSTHERSPRGATHVQLR